MENINEHYKRLYCCLSVSFKTTQPGTELPEMVKKGKMFVTKWHNIDL